MAKKKYGSVAEFFIKNPEKWIRGAMHGSEGSCCVVGGCENVYPKDWTDKVGTLASLVRTGTRCYFVSHYNDCVAEDVIDIVNLCLAADV